MKIRRAVSVLVLSTAPGLTGCLWHTHSVQMTHPPVQVIDAPLGQLLKQTNDRYAAMTTMTASISIAASIGGAKNGSVKVYTDFSGHLLMRKAADLRMILNVPVLGTTGMDMVTDGKTFTIVVPRNNAVIQDSNQAPEKPSSNPLYNLRPQMFFDSMFVRGLEPGEKFSLTMDERIYQPNPKKKELVDEPEYDLHFMRQKGDGSEFQTLRVIHIGRSNLLPYQQDIYDDAGQLVTQATYDNYHNFGGIYFPTKVTIERPVDQLKIVVTIDPTKLVINQQPTLEDDQFQITVPENYKICKPSVAPCSL